MIDIIVTLILITILGLACIYIHLEKKKGKKCIGCPYSGRGSCHCVSKKLKV